MRYLRLCVIKADMDYLQLVCLKLMALLDLLCGLLFIDWCLIEFYILKCEATLSNRFFTFWGVKRELSFLG